MAAFVLAQCVEPYAPDVSTPPDSYLVVEASISGAEGFVKLTRSQPIGEIAPPVPELRAQLRIETETGKVFAMTEQGGGSYAVSGMTLQSNEYCKLHIRTRADKEYESFYVPVKTTPEIDSISWKVNSDGLNLYVNTHDPLNQTVYYMWEFEETAQYNSAYRSQLVWDHQTSSLVVRTPENDIYNCWTTEKSESILIGTSVKLQNDVIKELLVQTVPPTSWKHSLKYSILVRQYALTREAYDYWLSIKKTTEEVGSLFDPQPANVEGNIRCITNVAEPVVGFFSISTVTEKRIFITPDQLPMSWFTARERNFPSRCIFTPVDTILIDDIMLDPDEYLIIHPIAQFDYSTHEPACIDCRLQKGATNVKPDFWE